MSARSPDLESVTPACLRNEGHLAAFFPCRSVNHAAAVNYLTVSDTSRQSRPNDAINNDAINSADYPKPPTTPLLPTQNPARSATTSRTDSTAESRRRFRPAESSPP